KIGAQDLLSRRGLSLSPRSGARWPMTWCHAGSSFGIGRLAWSGLGSLRSRHRAALRLRTYLIRRRIHHVASSFSVSSVTIDVVIVVVVVDDCHETGQEKSV